MNTSSLPHAEHYRSLVRRCVDAWFLREIGSIPTYADDSSLALLGMDSLAAAQLALDISEETGIDINDELIFEHSSVDALGNLLAVHSPPQPLTPSDVLP